MPELPEVETVCRSLSQHLPGHKIERVEVRATQLRHPLSSEEFNTFCQGRKILELRRRGKYIIDELEGSRALLLHLGMTGAYRVVEQDTEIKKHEHVIFELSGGLSWRYEDPRRFGILKCVELPAPGMIPESLFDLGPEPLGDEFTANYLFKISRKRVKPLKNFIMDSKIVVGVGNIYAAEVLFRSGLSPFRPAGKLKKKEALLLVEKIREVLNLAIEAGGTTIRDFKAPDGSEGYFFRALEIYGREDEACIKCSTPVKRSVQAGRSTFYCSKCQR